MDKTTDNRPPLHSDLRSLRANNSIAVLHLLFSVISLFCGIFLSVSPREWGYYIVGQILLALSFIHAFILLHEAGHHTLFTRSWANTIVGHLAGYLALIPYTSWKPIHDRHHRYTGWQDLDATTAALTPRPIADWERRIIDFAWWSWLPLFSILYRLQNYWQLPRVARYLKPNFSSIKLKLNMAVLLLGYGLTIVWIGITDLIILIGPGLLLALMLQDLILLSQHTHMPTNLSQGENVQPFAPAEQVRFTRSLRLPNWFSIIIMHFDAHELHHMYPAVPGYLLRRIPYTPPNEVHWLLWIRTFKRLTGTTFLFDNRQNTGIDI